MLVIDASIAAAWLYHDENEAIAELTITRMAEEEAAAPVLWQYEIRNLLLMGVRRNRIDPQTMRERLEAVGALPIRIDHEPDLGQALDLAEKHRMTFYDALYLELASRHNAELATLDKALQASARKEGITLVA